MRLPLREISGRECIRILCNRFGFSIARQKGSHIVLTRIEENRKIGTVVPNHKRLKPGTLKSILKLAEIDESRFAEYL